MTITTMPEPPFSPSSSPSRSSMPAPLAGVGIGYRRPLHAELVSADLGALDFLEVAPENYLSVGGRRRRQLNEVAARWPLVTHGLAMSLAGSAGLDGAYVDEVAAFVEAIGSPWHSDHLAVSAAGGSHTHELLPPEMTPLSASRTAHRIRVVKETFGVPFAVENASAYARRRGDTMDEADFVTEVVTGADCHLLLDINNIYVNSQNFHLDPYELLSRLPLERTVQIHMAGHRRESPQLLLDTHGAPIAAPVYDLLEVALERTGPVPVLIERDHDIPPLAEMLAEVQRVRSILTRVFGADDKGGRHAVA